MKCSVHYELLMTSEPSLGETWTPERTRRRYSGSEQQQAEPCHPTTGPDVSPAEGSTWAQIDIFADSTLCEV